MSAFSDLALAHADLQSYWKLDELSGNAIDYGPAGIAGVYEDSGIGQSPIRGARVLVKGENPCVRLWGSASGSMMIEFGDVYDFGDNVPYSFSMWVSPTLGATSSAAGIGGKGSGANGGYDFFYDNIGPTPGANGSFWGRRYDSAGASDLFENRAHLNYGWIYFVTYRYNGTHIDTFVNGVAGNSNASSRLQGVGATSFRIGCQASGGNVMYGDVGHVLVHDVAISLTEHTDLYNAGKLDVVSRPLTQITSPAVLALE